MTDGLCAVCHGRLAHDVACPLAPAPFPLTADDRKGLDS